jgi:CRISPR-associated protein Cmr1
MIKVPVTFETITPLFTGDENQKMKEIKPASIMGSLRFWFEVICDFSEMFEGDRFKNNEFDYDKYQSYIKNHPYATDEEICDCLKLSPGARYFGCTGWKSKIGIESVMKVDESKISTFETKDFKNYLGLGKITIDTGRVNQYGPPKTSNWYPPPKYYFGGFQVAFSVSNIHIRDKILYPLLIFIQQHAFIGGKNNLGFGRIKIVDYLKTEFRLPSSLLLDLKYNDLVDDKTLPIDHINVFQDLLAADKPDNTKGMPAEALYGIIDKIPKKIRTTSNVNIDTTYLEVLKSLLRIRLTYREQIRFDNSLILRYNSLKNKGDMRSNNEKKEYQELSNWHRLRHCVFGSTQEKETEAAKILPLINQDQDGRYSGYLISYAGILIMGEAKRGGQND